MLRSGLRLHFAPPSGSELPARLLVGKWGRNASVNGDYTINETTARELPGNLRRLGYDSVALDFDHNTVKGSPAYQAESEPRKVAAHGILEVVLGEGLYFVPRTWTPEGRTATTGGHFPDLSPAIVTNAAGEVIFVDSVALCRQGATEGLSLSLNAVGLGALAPAGTTTPASSPKMDHKKLLLLLLGLPETATDAEIESAAKTKATQIESATTAATAATNAVKTMGASLEAVLKRLDDGERAALTHAAIAAGKLIPQSATALSLEQFRALVAELPAGQVPLERRTPEGVKLHSTAHGLSETDEAIRTQLGLTREQWDAK